MDILKPPIVCIDRRCYRQNPIQRPAEWAEPDEDMQEEDDMYDDHLTDELSCELLNLKQTDKGYSLTMEVPSSFFGHIIGRQGETRKRIEQETKTRISIPNKSHTEVNEIVIHGEQRAGIISAHTRIGVIVSSARQRAPFTHILTMPFNTQAIQGQFQDFKEDVLQGSQGDEGLDVSLFQKPAKLHLTLGTLVLMTRKEVEKAQELLEACKQEIINPILGDSFLLVNLEGLDYMNDEPGRVDVLYAKAALKDGSNKLQLICDSLVDRFVCAGLMQKEHEKVKIHITLMNTLFRKEPDAEEVSKRQKAKMEGKEGRDSRERRKDKIRESFDASRILKDFAGYSFGDCLISSIQISQRGSYGADGYYLPVGSIAIP